MDEFVKLSSIKLISLLIRYTLVLPRFCTLLYVSYSLLFHAIIVKNCIPVTTIISWRKMIIISHQRLHSLLIGSYMLQL